MKRASFLLPMVASVFAVFLLAPERVTRGYTTTGDLLGLDQRDVRVFDNFLDAAANDNTTFDPSLPGFTGAELAIWKAAVEWGSSLHGDGNGDPTQLGDLGSGGANFDYAFGGHANARGSTNDNIVSALTSCGAATGAFTETPTFDGWRITLCDGDIVWSDGPGIPSAGESDIQGLLTHEFGHALGLGHTTAAGATMFPSVSSSGQVAARSIEADDIAGIQALYGTKSATKPEIGAAAFDPATGVVTISGANFAATGNEAWFTRATPSAPATAPLVVVAGLASTGGGTQIALALPADAGSGDVLVKAPGASGDVLSNAFPLDTTPASATSRNGSGTNPSIFTALTLPILGTVWTSQIDASGLGGSGVSIVVGVALPLAGLQTSLGELLIDLSSAGYFASAVPLVGGVAVHGTPVPNDANLIGFSASSQAFVGQVSVGTTRLTNALDVIVGT
jgi:hypothetical protein